MIVKITKFCVLHIIYRLSLRRYSDDFQVPPLKNEGNLSINHFCWYNRKSQPAEKKFFYEALNVDLLSVRRRYLL
jgi:hypothetical protein